MDTSDVVLVIKAANCGACKKLTAAWPSMEKVLKQNFPSLRFQVLDFISFQGQFDPSKIPMGVGRLPSAFPSYFYVPGPLWNNAVSELGKGKLNPINFVISSVHGFDYKLVNHDGKMRFEHLNSKNFLNVNEITSWLNGIVKTNKTVKTEKVKEKVEEEKVEPIKTIKTSNIKQTKGGLTICPNYKLKPKK